MQKGQFVLTGTAVVEQKSIAFLRESAGGKSRSVRVGETINGLLVAEVQPDRVRLTMGDDSEELVLKVAAGPRTTTQPAPPSVPGAVPVPGAPTAGRAGGPAAGPKATDGAVPTAATPDQAAAAPAAAGSAETSLLERRRAARAAQAAAEAAARAGQAGAPSAPATATPAAPAAGDAGWSDVYRRMQQPRR
jgi:type IV secretory pathway VirB10-like protein